jgi:hypothetical protein
MIIRTRIFERGWERGKAICGGFGRVDVLIHVLRPRPRFIGIFEDEDEGEDDF